MKTSTFMMLANNNRPLALPEPFGNLCSQDRAEYLKELEEKATKAGYNCVSDYLDACNMKNPKYLESAGQLYKECVAEHDVESKRCEYSKKYWLECKAANALVLIGHWIGVQKTRDRMAGGKLVGGACLPTANLSTFGY